MKVVALIFSLFLFSCRGKNTVPHNTSEGFPEHAQFFSIEDNKDHKRIRVFDPWQKAKNIEFSYILSSSPSGLNDSLKSFPCIRVPVRKAVAMSTTHVGFISALDQALSIAGVSGPGFINDSLVREAIRKNLCFEVGYHPNIDYERIISIHPDVVFLYGLENSILNVSERLKEAGIPSVIVSEYLENHPLGKAEWIRFFAAFYDCEEKGDSIFNKVRDQYISLRDSVNRIKWKPLVLSGLPWKEIWYLPGGSSFAASFITDAGGEYLWQDNHSNEYIALDLESVFLRALDAEVWINSGTVESRSELLSHDERFNKIRAFRSDSVFNNNARLSEGGGNDFWESGAVYPNVILHDLIEIFHPDLLEGEELYYYRKLE